MTFQTVTLQLPKTIYQSARRTAKVVKRPLKQQKLSRLLRKNQAGTLTERERETLDELISESERLMLRKARAYALLKWRGYAPAMIERDNNK